VYQCCEGRGDAISPSPHPSRGRADDLHIDLHVLVDASMHRDKAHHLSHAIENKIKRNFRGATDVVIHMEPMEERKEQK